MAFCWDVSSVCSDHHGEQVYHKLTHRRAQGISEIFLLPPLLAERALWAIHDRRRNAQP